MSSHYLLCDLHLWDFPGSVSSRREVLSVWPIKHFKYSQLREYETTRFWYENTALPAIIGYTDYPDKNGLMKALDLFVIGANHECWKAAYTKRSLVQIRSPFLLLLE
jgi:hypothetical protein